MAPRCVGIMIALLLAGQSARADGLLRERLWYSHSQFHAARSEWVRWARQGQAVARRALHLKALPETVQFLRRQTPISQPSRDLAASRLAKAPA